MQRDYHTCHVEGSKKRRKIHGDLCKYLGSIFEVGGGKVTDVQARIGMTSHRFGKLQHLWNDNDLHLILRIHMYKACVCNILTYGSEL